MSQDTTFFIKGKQFRLTAPMKAALIYVLLDVGMNSLTQLGQALFELKQTDWRGWWAAQRTGWVLLQAGSIITSALLTLKAFFSNSNKPASPADPAPPSNLQPPTP